MSVSKIYRVIDDHGTFDDCTVKASPCRTYIVLEVEGDELFLQPGNIDEFIEVIQTVRKELV